MDSSQLLDDHDNQAEDTGNRPPDGGATLAGRTKSRFGPATGGVIASCLVLYCLLAVLIYWPANPVDPNRMPGGGFGDPVQAAWFLAWIPYALRHGLEIFHSNLVDYPSGVDLANNASMPLLGILASPVTVLLGPVSSLNVLLRLAFAASAGSMFLVLRQWCSRWPVAFFGGLIYGFSPYMVSQGQGDAHLDLVFAALPPAIVWCAYELVVVQRRRPIRIGALLGILAGAQVLISPEVLSDLAIVLALGVVALALSHRHAIRARARYVLTSSIIAVVAFLVVTGYFLWWMLFAKGHVSGPVQPTEMLQPLRASLASPFVPNFQQLIAPTGLANFASRFAAGNVSEQSGYLGVFLVALVTGFAIAWRRERMIRWAGILSLIAFLLSLGSSLTVAGHATGIPLPEAIFVHLPLLESTVPARFSLDVVLFTAVLFGLGLDRTLTWLSASRPTGRTRRRWRVGLGIGAACVLSIVALIPSAPFATSKPPWPSALPDVLDTIPPGTVVLSYPYPIRDWSQTMLWQASSGMRFRILGGYATVRGPNGDGTNVPPLAEPASVQEFLVEAQGGVGPAYPTVPPASVSNGDLCAYLNINLVGAVVYWAAGTDPADVLTLLNSALGVPTNRKDRGVLIWRIPKSGWCAGP